MGPEFSQRLDAALASIRSRITSKPQIAVVIGTGLSGILNDIEIEQVIPYRNIVGFPVSTAPSHKGELVLGTIGGQSILAQNGRFHFYEGWHNDDVVLPIYLWRALGVKTCIITNAAGALNAGYQVTDIMAITDHMNFSANHPLAGPNDERLGPRFPDLSQAYSPRLIETAQQTARELNLRLHRGIYTCVHGPEFETSAERRFLTMAGGDVVGMSSVPEVIAANHCGMQVLAFSAITNAATGAPDQQPDTLEEVIENADIAAAKLRKLILAMFANRSFDKEKS